MGKPKVSHRDQTRGRLPSTPREEQTPARMVKPFRGELVPLTDAQRDYDISIRVNTITFGIGSAGTGKTWWAAMRAAEALSESEIHKIIVTRPAVEAEDDKIGFLPGNLDEKYDPYFRPVKEALEEYFGTGALEYFIKMKMVEARPMAFLRGSTLKNCWVIADEMQNATPGQLKMLLTRIGTNCKMIVNGDPLQVDQKIESGLLDATRRLKNVKSVGTVRFQRSDIVRSGICQAVTEAYEVDPAAPEGENLEGETEGLNRFLCEKVNQD